MFYEPALRNHGLPHDPFKAIVAPRPIGWISAVSARGELNLAPYSFFNAFNTRPPIVGFSSEGRKDAVTFAEEGGAFVCNLVTLDLFEKMNATSAPLPRGVSEFEHAGLTPEPSRLVAPPRVREAAAALECRWLKTVSIEDASGEPTDAWLVLGQVVGVYVDERFIKDGRFDMAGARVLARAGYQDYVVADHVVSMARPEGG